MLSTDCKPDLRKIINTVHKKYFYDQHKPAISAGWEIPAGILAHGLREPEAGSISEELLEQCQDALIKENFSHLIEDSLRTLSENGFSRAYNLLATLLTHNAKNDEQLKEAIEFRDMYNEDLLKTKTTVAAACIDLSIPKISIHPYFLSVKTPSYVIHYLIHHELNHYYNENNFAHDKSFMETEKKFEHLSSALKWLKKNGFPVVER